MLLVVFFAILLAATALVLLLHHGWHHSHDPPDSNARLESNPLVCFFQIPDISNHETWIIVCLTNAFTLGILAPCLREHVL